jgi:hypothetical protein
MTRADPAPLESLDARPSAAAFTPNTTAIEADNTASLRPAASGDTRFMGARYLLTTGPGSNRRASLQASERCRAPSPTGCSVQA